MTIGPILLHRLIEPGMTLDGNHAAVIDGALELSHATLDALAWRLCSALRSAGAGPGQRVGLWMDKSAGAVVAIVAILRSGAAYVPIDPRAPARRAAFIVNDCALACLLVDSAHAAAADGLDIAAAILPISLERLQELPPCDSPLVDETGMDGDAPAYILYTSGSTGDPKGVIVPHRAACAFVCWAVEAFGIAPTDRLASHAPLHFDLSIFDLFAALAAGACVLLVPAPALLFAPQLRDWIQANAVTIWYSVPRALIDLADRDLLDVSAFPALRQVLFAGERIPPAGLKRLMARMQHARFHNLYGPTETNVVTAHAIAPDHDPMRAVPIGRAVAGADLRIVNGMLEVAGPGVMLGYWRRPEQSADALSADPDGLWYRTGDMVDVSDDGTLDFLGRRDNQVKLRGHRIELEEVEAALIRHENVSAAVAAVIDDVATGQKLLAAAAVSEPADATMLRRHCGALLPPYMVPNRIFCLPALPVTATAKIDRRAAVGLIADLFEQGISA